MKTKCFTKNIYEEKVAILKVILSFPAGKITLTAGYFPRLPAIIYIHAERFSLLPLIMLYPILR